MFFLCCILQWCLIYIGGYHGVLSVMVKMLGLNEAIDELALSNTVNWYGHVLWKACLFYEEGG